MDLLKFCRLPIDFDRGVLNFQDALPEDDNTLGERLVMHLKDDSPFLAATVGENRTERFLVDTGAQGNSLATDSFDELREQGLIRL